MKIKALIINDKYFYNTYNKNLIYSIKNSVGKTTLLRMLLFSMGFSVPSTNGINFDEIKTKLKIIQNSFNYSIIRQNGIIQVYKNNEFLNEYSGNDNHEVISLLLNSTNDLIINNILGTFYFDQEKGWTLLNRGKVIGGNDFSIEEFLSGMNDKDLSGYIEEKKKIKDDLKFYNATEKLLELNDKVNESNFNFSDIDRSEAKLFNIKTKINQNKKDINNLILVKKDNENLLRIISEYHLMVKYRGKEIEIKKDNLKNYNENNSIIDTRIIHLKLNLNKLKKEKNKIQDEMKNIELLHGFDNIERFKREISNIDMTPNQINNISDNLKTRRTKINKLIKNIINKSSAMQDLYNIITKYADELGVLNYIDNTPNFVLTRNLKKYSGAIFHLIVFAYRMSLLKLLENRYSFNLPIILDSPATGELDNENLKKIFKLLKKHFNNHQLIVASINDLSNIDVNWDNKLLLNNDLFDSLKKYSH